MSNETKKRGGPGKGQGRKPIDTVPTVIYPIRLKVAQRKKLQRLGGAKWVRKKIDEENEP